MGEQHNKLCPDCNHPEHDNNTCQLACPACLWLEYRRWKRGGTNRYVEALNYRHAVMTMCPCGSSPLDVNEDCHACLYRHYWWHQAGFSFSKWLQVRDNRTDYVCPLCPVVKGMFLATPGCEGCQHRMPTAVVFRVPVPADVYNTTSWCTLCGAPRGMFTPGCFDCVEYHCENHTAWVPAIERILKRGKIDGDALVPPDNPVYEVQRPDIITTPASPPCKGCGLEDSQGYTLDCKECYKRHYRFFWVRGLYTPYKPYIDYISLKVSHKTCSGVMKDGTPCGTPTLCYREGCRRCRKRWSEWDGYRGQNNNKPAFPTPPSVIDFHKRLRASKEVTALSKVTIFPQVELPPNSATFR